MPVTPTAKVGAQGSKNGIFMPVAKPVTNSTEQRNAELDSIYSRAQEYIKKLTTGGVDIDPSNLKASQDKIFNLKPNLEETEQDFNIRKNSMQEYLSNLSTDLIKGGQSAIDMLKSGRVPGQVVAPSFSPDVSPESSDPLTAAEENIAELQASLDEATKTITEKDKTLIDVSSQVSDFGAKLNEIKTTQADAITAMNSAIAGLGDRVASLASYTGNNPAILSDPGVQSQLVNAWRQGGTVDERNKRLKNIIKAASGDPIFDKGGYNPPDPAETSINTPSLITGEPQTEFEELDAYNALNAAEMGFYSSPPSSFDSVNDYLGTIGSDGSIFFSDDLDMLSLSAIGQYDTVRAKLQDFYNTRRKTTQYWFDTYTDFFKGQNAAGEEILAMGRDTNLDAIELEMRRIKAEKADSAADLSDQTTRIEGFIKARMVAAGIPMEGQTGATMLANSLSRWYRTAAKIQSDFNFDLSKLHNQSAAVINKYTADVIGLHSSNAEKLLGVQFQLNESWQKTQESVLMNDIQIQMKQFQALSDYATEKRAAEAEEKKQIREMMETRRKELWDIQKEAITANGYIPTVGQDGQITFYTDANGDPVYSLEGQKLFKEMQLLGKSVETNEFGELVMYDLLNPGSYASLGYQNPSTGLPWEGMEAQGNFVIRAGNNTFANGQGYTGKAQCVGGARTFVPDLPGGLDNIYDKRQIYSGFKDFEDMKPGDVVFTNGGDTIESRFSGAYEKTGHAAVIESIDFQNRTVRVVDVNFNGDGKWGARTFGFNQIDRDPATDNIGIFRGSNPTIPVIEGEVNSMADHIFSNTEWQNLNMSKWEESTLNLLRAGGLTKTAMFDDIVKRMGTGRYSQAFEDLWNDIVQHGKAKEISPEQAAAYGVPQGITQFILDDMVDKRDKEGRGNRLFWSARAKINPQGEVIGASEMNNFLLVGDQLQQAKEDWDAFRKIGGSLKLTLSLGGPLGRGVGKISERLIGYTPEQLRLYRQFSALTGTSLVNYVRKISGAAVTDAEYQRLQALKPNPSMTDATFEDQLNRAISEYNSQLQTSLNTFNFASRDAFANEVRGVATSSQNFPTTMINQKMENPPPQNITIPRNMSRSQAISLLEDYYPGYTEADIQYLIETSNAQY